MKINDEMLKLQATKLILKHDLGYTFTEEEKKLLSVMSDVEMQMIRKNILKNVRNQILEIDVLEDYLNILKEEEYRRYLNHEGKELLMEEQMEELALLEGKCSRMIINIANGASNVEDLLGPSIHETYGVTAKK